MAFSGNDLSKVVNIQTIDYFIVGHLLIGISGDKLWNIYVLALIKCPLELLPTFLWTAHTYSL